LKEEKKYRQKLSFFREETEKIIKPFATVALLTLPFSYHLICRCRSHFVFFFTIFAVFSLIRSNALRLLRRARTPQLKAVYRSENVKFENIAAMHKLRRSVRE
jgi:hypothetical protein